MIYDASALPTPLALVADLVVVGSGPGGATVAMIAAEAGLRVVVLEAGDYVPPTEMNQREEQMLPRLFWDAGNRASRDRTLKLHQGRGVGGSALHNTNLCKRVPATIRDAWARQRGLERLPPERWEALYAEVEALLGVAEIPADRVNRANRLLAEGAARLGWRHGPLSHNRTGCVGSGFCELGCAYDAKNNALKVCVPRAVAAGAEILARCQAVRVLHEGGRVIGVEAVALDPLTRAKRGPVSVAAPRVCLSASATATAALLLRSRVPDPGGETGRGLRVHPAVVVAGDYEEPVRAWEGIPQSWECTELLELEREDPAAHGIWILPAFAHPMATATLVPGFGPAHRERMRRYAHLSVLTAMVHDRSAGVVRPRGELGLSIDYRVNEADRAELGLGLWAAARLHFAAGARRVLVPGRTTIELESEDQLERLAGLDPLEIGQELTAVHPMSSVPMGDDPSVAAVDSAGRHHHLQGLWVADGSLFPTSIGVPPQLSIYAMGLHVGRAIVG